MTDDWQAIRDYMARPDVRAAVARYEDNDEEEPPELEQLAMRLDMPTEQSGRAGA